MSTFKVGDRVRTLDGVYSSRIPYGSEGYIKRSNGMVGGDGGECFQVIFDNGYTGSFHYTFIEIIEKPPKTATEAYIENQLGFIGAYYNAPLYYQLRDRINKTKKQTIMTTIKTFVKNLTLSADEKLLRKYELHNSCGENTCEAKEAILENFYNTPENQAYLLSLAQGLEADEVKSK